MGRFTKRPVTIDAILAGEVLDGASSGRFSRKPENTNPIPDWVRDAFEQAVIGFESVGDPDPAFGSECVLINTQGHGQVRAERTDWIIRGINGELYPCRPDVFAATYDAGESPQQIPIIKIVDQPPPKATELPAVWELVIADYRLRSEDLDAEVVRDVLDDMTARDATGRERYGVPLTAYNGRDQLVDAYQEQLDGAVYLRAAIEEGLNVNEIYAATLDSITQLRAFINGRKKS